MVKRGSLNGDNKSVGVVDKIYKSKNNYLNKAKKS